MKNDIGLSDADRQKVAESLSRVLADTYTLYLKTQNFHWNVTGPQFRTLHLMFEEQYTDLAEAVDEIAERIRALGAVAPGSFSQFAKLSSIQEATAVPSAEDMIRQLVSDNETADRTLRATANIAEEVNDIVTADLVTQRMAVHEKAAWMMRSVFE
jgi:starvation-inducible DNA-binding protein